jgi:hypothetical protein
MTEDFIYYLWKYKLLEPGLKTTEDEVCQIIDPGLRNMDSGPDFFNAKIKLGQTIWAGNVEIHVNSSDWNLHKHQYDDSYDNIILHVVFMADEIIVRKNGTSIPTLEIADKFNPEIYSRYQNLVKSKSNISCAPLIRNIDRFTIQNWLDRMLVERLEEKSIQMEEKLQYNNNDWSETFYQALAGNFGFKVNSLPFELTARSIPVKILAKHKDNATQLEALLFGQAGFLAETSGDAYYTLLKKEYDFLSVKYKLQSIDKHLWRFMRLRPVNFPTIRLSQFAMLVSRSNHLLSKILEFKSVKNLNELFNVQASEYWDTHFTFGKKTAKTAKKLGKTAVDLLLINTVAPFLFVYGMKKHNQEFKDKALKLLDQVPGEKNHVIKQWELLEMNTRTAYNTQALLQLKPNYCDKKKCLFCALGHKILKSKF